MDREYLKSIFEQYGLQPDVQMIDRFEKYAEMLVERNKVVNLTAITEDHAISVKHFLDSCLIFAEGTDEAGNKCVPVLTTGSGVSVIDVGTGAGFPGVPVKIYDPSIRLTLLDALDKRITFLKDLSAETGLSDNVCVHYRAEEGARKPELREQFDIAVSRAVANLTVLSEYCLPYVKVGGIFAAYKSEAFEEEMEGAGKAIETLGGMIEEVKNFELPEEAGSRKLIVIRKIAPTPEKYPRRAGKIEKNPIR